MNTAVAAARAGLDTDATSIQVVGVEVVAEGVVAVTLADPTGRRLPPWTPGSHIDVILPNGLVRQYSLCGDRWDAYTYRIAVLRETAGSGGSEWIHTQLAEGQILGFGGPRNHFHLVPAERYLFIAGGIGITPLLPMIQQADRLKIPWKLLYGGRWRRSMAFADELTDARGHVDLVPENEFGRPDIADWVGDIEKGTRVYCCGPAGLLDAAERASANWLPHTLHTERFVNGAGRRADDRPFVVHLQRSGLDLPVAPGTSILDAMAQAGVGVLSSCRQGTCGTCEVAVLAGRPDHRDSMLSETDRDAGDCILVCVSRAHTSTLTLDA
ncbi:PDR/VanB family oxidoreductase [Gordonia humi]|uniref:Ferredoxin-NADP reductase n=1 Tax=Gordonia humi TaxID=686429 RepID=A0A840FDC4_9ACTN|nr:PDR/VanB family oxidoreductase [Gordonia humi]MBB4138120.1 ferredoxin-NADP reductase [Gordonia humi]